jgi:ribonuclease P protein component
VPGVPFLLAVGARAVKSSPPDLVLPAQARVRSRTEHRLVAARGRRARRGPLVVHLLPAAGGVPAGPTRAGVVVGRRVGPSVRRNLVKRRLRHLLRDRLAQLPAGSLVVVRALPGAEVVDFSELGTALDSALSSATRAAGGTRSRNEVGA